MSERGKYIVIEGHDGTGKSTQVNILRETLETKGIESVKVEEPAGVPIADAIRTVVKDGTLERDPTTELLLFTAARREINRQLIIPSLEDGTWVIAARNWVSTMAYQGFGGDLQTGFIRKVTEQNTDKNYMNPDFMCILALKNKAEQERRIAERGELATPDAFESRDDRFQHEVEVGYETIAALYEVPTIDASGSIEEVTEAIWSHVHPLTEAA